MFNDPHVGLVAGNLKFISSRGGFVRESLYWRFETMLRKLETDYYSTISASGPIIVIRKNIFKKIPTHNGLPDDFILPLSILEQNYRVVHLEEVVATTVESDTISDEFKRRIRIGIQNYHSLRFLFSLVGKVSPFIVFAIFSHKILRWFVPFFMVAILLYSSILFNESLFINIMFFLQMAFYIAVSIGFVLNVRKIKNPIFISVYYFFAMNLALIIGFIRFLFSKDTSSAWEA